VLAVVVAIQGGGAMAVKRLAFIDKFIPDALKG
jgi:hypothetical protein